MSFFKVVLLINKTQTKEFLNHEKTTHTFFVTYFLHTL